MTKIYGSLVYFFWFLLSCVGLFCHVYRFSRSYVCGSFVSYIYRSLLACIFCHYTDLYMTKETFLYMTQRIHICMTGKTYIHDKNLYTWQKPTYMTKRTLYDEQNIWPKGSIYIWPGKPRYKKDSVWKTYIHDTNLYTWQKPIYMTKKTQYNDQNIGSFGSYIYRSLLSCIFCHCTDLYMTKETCICMPQRTHMTGKTYAYDKKDLRVKKETYIWLWQKRPICEKRDLYLTIYRWRHEWELPNETYIWQKRPTYDERDLYEKTFMTFHRWRREWDGARWRQWCAGATRCNTLQHTATHCNT